jgi:chromatin segregation and condensation protein Rec8/ScpA/Scc1 (kleisin family)
MMLSDLNLIAAILAMAGALLAFASLILARIVSRASAEARETERDLDDLLARLKRDSSAHDNHDQIKVKSVTADRRYGD